MEDWLNEIRPLGIHFHDEFPLRWAAENGRFDLVKTFVEQGANVKINSGIVLTEAVKSNHFEMIKYLVEHGANVNDGNYYCPIRVAVEKNNMEVVKYLIEHGADVNIFDNGAVQEAVKNKNKEMVEFLLANGAIEKSPFVESNYTSPVVTAIKSKNFDIAHLLIQRGWRTDKLTPEQMSVYIGVFNYKFKCRLTDESCLISHSEIEEDESYYVCTENSSHIYSKGSMDSWGGKLDCLLCLKPLDKQIYSNSRPKPKPKKRLGINRPIKKSRRRAGIMRHQKRKMIGVKI